MPEGRAATGWVDPTVVARALGAPELATDPDLEAACDAAAELVATWRADLTDPETGDYAPTPDVDRGAVILAVDLYRRPATYGGAGAMLGDLGSLGMVPGVDPMVERLLGIGRYRRGGRLG
jgi:hypothetical protein